MEHQKIWRRLLPIAAGIAAAALALRFLGPVLLPFGVGLLFALTVDPAVTRLQRQIGLPRWAAAGISIAALYLVLILLLAILCRLLWQELSSFVRSLPTILTAFSGLLTQWKQRLLSLGARFPDDLAQIFTQIITDTEENSAGLAEKVYDWLFSFASGLLKQIPDILLFLLTAVLSSFMLAAELPKLRLLWQKKAPPLWQRRTKPVLFRLKSTLGGWLKAQLKLMSISALVLTAGFLILRIDYPLLFGLVIALIDALPALGTGLILIPWGLFMFLQGNSFLGTGLLLLYGTAALLRTALEPRLLGKQMGLDPLLTLLALYSGYRFLGILGMILFPIGTIMVKQFWNYPETRTAD